SKENYADRKRIALENLSAVLHYAESKQFCRSQLLLRYFGEKESHRCGICDVCLERNKLDLSELEFTEINDNLKKLLTMEKMAIPQIMNQIEAYKKDKVMKVIQFGLDSDVFGTDGLEYWLV